MIYLDYSATTPVNDEVLDQIKNCINNSLDLAKNNNIDTICIPNLAVKYEDKEIVAKTIMNTVKDYLIEDKFFKKVVINVLILDSYDIYSKYI